MSGQCPVCTAAQAESLACHACTTRLERALGDVRSLVTELDTAKSKMARIGNPSGGGGLARERNPISWGAVEAADTLGNVLTTWVREVAGESWWKAAAPIPSTHVAAHALLFHIDAIRRHPAVAEMVDEITDAVEQARRAVDRPADRRYLGQCMVETPDPLSGEDVTCYAELWAKPEALEVSCKVCGIEHPVAERRAWLLLKAADMLVSVKEASRYVGDVGGIDVTEASIRGLLQRKQKLAYRAPVEAKRFRLGDLLDVLADMRMRTPDVA